MKKAASIKSHVTFATSLTMENNAQFVATLQRTHPIHKKQPPIGIRNAFPKQQTRIQPNAQHNGTYKTDQHHYVSNSIRIAIHSGPPPLQTTDSRAK
jgi:hypothetical protein